MDISSFILNKDLPGLLITLAGQSILISLIGLTVLKVLSKRSAPVRSLVCSATMIALGLTLVISFGFYIKGISWSQATLPFVIEKNATNSILLTSDQNTIASTEIRTLPLKIKSQTPVENNITSPAPATSSHSSPFVLPVLLLINITGLFWLAGILFQIVRLGYGIIIVKKFRNSLQSSRDDQYDKILQAVAERFRKKRLPKLYSSPLIKSPVTIGLFNPIVIIPQKLTSTITENEMKSILLHELAHIYHYDQIAGVIKRIVMAFHWWNPFVYQINSHHEQAREEVSDNYVLRELQPKVYSQCLMDLTKKVCLISSYPTAVGMAGRRFNLRKRIEQILSKKRNSTMETKLYLKTIIFSFCLVLVFGVAGLHGKVNTKTAEPAAGIIPAIEPVTDTASIIKKEIKILSGEKTAQVYENLLAKLSEEKATKKHVIKNIKPTIISASTEIHNDKIPDIKTETVQGEEPSEAAQQREDPSLDYTSLGISNLKSGRIDEAVSAFNNAIEINAGNFVAYYSRGIAYYKQGKIDKAISDYNKSIEIFPGFTAAYQNRAYTYLSMGDYEKAVSDYNRAIEIEPGDPDLYNMRGMAYCKQGQIEKAISDYSRAIEINPEFVAAYHNRGYAYQLLLEGSLLKTKFSETHKKPSGNMVYKEKGIIKNALSDYTRAIELRPGNADLYFYRGNIYYLVTDYENALPDFDKAIELNPEAAVAKVAREYREDVLFFWYSRRYSAGGGRPVSILPPSAIP